jgi:hypothetical protein
MNEHNTKGMNSNLQRIKKSDKKTHSFESVYRTKVAGGNLKEN